MQLARKQIQIRHLLLPTTPYVQETANTLILFPYELAAASNRMNLMQYIPFLKLKCKHAEHIVKSRVTYNDKLINL